MHDPSAALGSARMNSACLPMIYFLLSQEAHMNKIPAYLNVLLGVALIALLLPGARVQAITPTPTPPPAVAEEPACDSSRTVQVSGTAVIHVVPDRALIQLGVQSNALTTREVQKDNNTAIQAVMGALEELGIAPEDIATDWYYIRPVYSDSDSMTIKGYRIDNTVAVTLKDVKKINEVISAALEAGANQVINVELYTSELRKYRDEARDLAVKAAREKAEALTSAAGAQVGCVITITENVWSYYSGWYGRGGSQDIWTQNVVQNAGPAGGQEALTEAGAVTLGQISIRAEVATTFSLK
jgi:uncharacterized protein YggE